MHQENFLKITKTIGKIPQVIPFIRAVILNGSLAAGKAKESSDIDILIITKSNRLWTARFLILITSFLLGLKRSKDELKSHAGKACFNYFLSEDYLRIPTGRGDKVDQYCADNYVKSVLVWGDGKIFKKFFTVNEELFAKSKNQSKAIFTKIFPVKDILFFKLKRLFIESILNNKVGDKLEKFLMNLQIKMINRDSRTQKHPDFIVFNEKEARFHPPKI